MEESGSTCGKRMFNRWLESHHAKGWEGHFRSLSSNKTKGEDPDEIEVNS